MFKFLSFTLIQLTLIISSGNFFSFNKNFHQSELTLKDSIAAYKKSSIKCYQTGDLDGFGNYTKKILRIGEVLNLTEVKVRALINLAIYHQRKDDYNKALTNYIDAEKLTVSLEDSSYLKVILNANLGNLYYRIEDFENAKKTMKRVLALATYQEEAKKNKIKISAINTLANIYSDEKKFTEAFKYYDTLKVMLNNGDDNNHKLSALYFNIAESYLEIGNYKEAIKNGELALAKIGKEKYIETEALAKQCIGVSHLKLNNYEKALTFLKSSNKIAINDGLLKLQMESHQYLAKVYESLNSIDKAFEEQKKFTVARETYLKTLTKAQRLKLENESKYKSQEINKQKKEITFLNEQKILYTILGLVLATLFLVFAFQYYKKRKHYLKDTVKIKGDNTFLENENDVLKDKLNNLALVLKKENKTREFSKNKQSSLSIQDQEAYKDRILNYMETNMPYLNSEIKQLDVAKELDMSIHLLSKTLNTCFQQNFNSFINLYRVEKAKVLLKDTSFKNHKLLSIAYDSGFSSKSSFNRIFKNLVDTTPSEYQKKHMNV